MKTNVTRKDQWARASLGLITLFSVFFTTRALYLGSHEDRA